MTGKRFSPQFTAAFVLLVIHFLIGLTLALLSAAPYDAEVLVGGLGGAAVGQVALCAAWMALSERPFTTRLLISLGCVFLVGLALSCHMLRNNAPTVSALAAAASVFVLWLFVQAPLWMFRWWQGWRLCWQETAPSTTIPVRFGIRELLAWTAAVALLTAIGRMLFHLEESYFGTGERRIVAEVVFVGMLMIFSVLLQVPALCATLTDRSTTISVLAIVAIGCAVTVCELVTIKWLRFETDISLNLFVSVLNAAQLLAILATVLILRAVGYRLRRVPSSA